MSLDFKAQIFTLNTDTNQQVFAVSFFAIRGEKADPSNGFICRASVKLRDHAELEHFIQFDVDFTFQHGGNIACLHRRVKIRKRNFEGRHV